MYAVDRFLEKATDARFAIIVVAIVLGWPSTPGFTVPEIAGQLGCSPSTIGRACAKFREMSGLGGSAGGVRLVGNSAGSAAKSRLRFKHRQIFGRGSLSHGEINPIEIMMEPLFNVLCSPEFRPRLFNAGNIRKPL
jgi:hypothetical protein